MGNQGRNHVVKVGGSSFLVWGITALLQKKIERYTQFGAVCYPQQTPTKKLRKKSGAVQFFRGVRIPPAPVVASMGTMCGPDNGVAEGDLGAEH